VVAFPPPPITLRQRSSTCVEPLLASLRRVLSKGCHSFLSKWLEKVSQPSLAEPFGSDSGRMELTVRLSFPSLGRHRTDCRSLCRSRRPRVNENHFVSISSTLSAANQPNAKLRHTQSIALCTTDLVGARERPNGRAKYPRSRAQ
jgi:hypothetical protein